MTTLLLDLDNTLLSNDMDRFMPAYLRALSAHLAPYTPPERMVSKLLEGTRRMVANRRPDCRLIEVFNEVFYPGLGFTVEELRGTVERFYAEVFPELQALTRPRPEAVALVEAAFERGYRVVIATNPLFPRAAILHRLAWAGLPMERYPFDLIAAVEDFHFAKPHPAFPAECLGRLGWPEDPVVMVGDNPENDIQAAGRLGLATYWIDPAGAGWTGDPQHAPTGSGGLSGLLAWLDQQPEQVLLPNYSAVSARLAVLQVTPALQDGWLRDLEPQAWSRSPAPGSWSLAEIVCHLRDVEREVNLPRLGKVLAEENPFLPGMDTDPWAEQRQYCRQDGPQALAQFTAARARLLDLLAGLPPPAWERLARHAILGPTRLEELAGIIASHDRLHIQQIYSLITTR